MRVTADVKLATRQRIIDTSLKLFLSKGVENTTTRDIAHAAQIAAGTLFNYFLTKEEIAVTIIAEALNLAHDEFNKCRHGDSLEEELFSFVAIGLRHLKPHKKLVQPVLETALCPVFHASNSPQGAALREEHTEIVVNLIMAHGITEQLSAAILHLYWTLYTGILRFWSTDTSRNSEDSLAMLDEWVNLFAASLRGTKQLAGAADKGEKS